MESWIIDPLLISLKVAFIATLIASILATLMAWRVSLMPGLFSPFIDALCSLPLVLPPTVIGFYLILILGRNGIIGGFLAQMGINLIFTWEGAAVASTSVIFPLVYKSSKAALSQVDRNIENVARILGASEWHVFIGISLPLAWKGILAGIMLAFARGMGEFGATLMIAGNIPGKTQTLALAIYSAFQAGDDQKAALLAILASFLCASLLTVIEIINRYYSR